MIKQGRLVDGHRAHRLTVSFAPANMALKIIVGHIETLAGPSLWTEMVFEESEIALVSNDDLVCSFYLVELPPGRSGYCCFSLPVAGSTLSRPETRL